MAVSGTAWWPGTETGKLKGTCRNYGVLPSAKSLLASSGKHGLHLLILVRLLSSQTHQSDKLAYVFTALLLFFCHPPKPGGGSQFQTATQQ